MADNIKSAQSAPAAEKLRFFGLGKMKPFLKPHIAKFAVMVVFTLIVGGLQVILPLFQQYAIDHFIAEKTTEGLALFICAYVGVLALSGVLDFIACYNCSRLELYLLRDIRRACFDRLQRLSVSYYSQNSVGRLHARVMSDPSNIAANIAWDTYSGVWNVIYVLGAVVVMLALQPVLALCVIVVIPLVALVSVYFQKKLTKLNREARELNSAITGAFNEGVTGVETSKTLFIENDLDARFFASTKKMQKRSSKIGHFRALFVTVIAFASSAALALVLWYGGALTADGLLLVGTLSVFMTYAQGIMEPVQWSVDCFSDLITVKVNIERVTALLAAEGDVKDTPEVIEKYGDSFAPKRENWEPLIGHICFDDVTFRYPDGGENVLEHFSLDVPQGTNVAIVGETGAGKSTLVNLVCRFYEPTEGRILIDGRDARERSVHWLHSNIGYVLQTPHLFSGTVRENLLYGKEDATEKEIAAALRAVKADGVVSRLEHGIDTRIGEGGNSLSTGEKQLLSFARAILADPAIFILDEATSSIDTLTEKLIQEAIQKLMEGRTSFVIAHRLSTITQADIILVVDGGKIVERGTHEELLRRRGAYFALYMKQFQEENIQKSDQLN